MMSTRQKSSAAFVCSGNNLEISLNHDVLCTVTSFLQIADVLSMMCTCRDLYAYGVVLLLSSGVHLENCKMIGGFCRFVLNDGPSRLPALRTLSFSICRYYVQDTDDVGQCISLLIEILSQASGLRALSISHYGDLVDLGGQQIISCLSGLTELNELCVHDLDIKGREIFQCMTKLTTLEVHFSTLEELDPLSLFTGSSASLRTVRLMRCCLHTPPNTQFSSVRLLQLDSNDYVEADPLLEAFPNLQYLHLVTTQTPRDYPARIQDHHDSNREHQIRRSWPQLRGVKGDVVSLYALALSGPVRSLGITSPYRSNPVFPVDYLRTVVSGLRPSHLSLELDTIDPNCDIYCSLPSYANEVTHFSLRLNAANREGIKLLTLLKSLSVVYMVLELWIRSRTLRSFESKGDRSRMPFFMLSEENFVRELAASNPTLRFLTIREGDGQAKYWDMLRSEGIGHDHDHILNDSEGRQFMKREGLKFFGSIISEEYAREASRYWLA
ncbi:hypothetical protein CERSUDRAFT_111760 [Gelatoporia subvermispora B]|uniref:F-box domain-containing protein n=1 Tax=Ceriporiopsis subvermispora (strain B) TaxID=914234 RepID=M2PS55_CERS8|nr:hypothetical protein CERSUDRAFT_111760 [Gelatoporia subvermispora B]